MQRTYPEGVTSWIDLDAPDETAVTEFYGALFGWTFERATPPQAPPYFIARLDGRDVAGLGRATDAGGWNTYVCVTDSAAMVDRVVAAGGAVLSGPDQAGEGGRSTVCRDSQGNPFRLWEPQHRLGAQATNEPGAWNFSNLVTDDPSTAQDFYGTVFGWRFHDLGFGTMITVDGYGDHLAATVDPGIRDRQDDIAAPPGFADAIGWIGPVAAALRPGWSVTFTVADRDRSAATVERLGGSVLHTETDDWSSSATVADPQGAVFVISQFTPPTD